MRMRGCVMLSLAALPSFAQSLVFPVDSYSVTGYLFAQMLDAAKRHLGEDAHGGVGTSVRAIADGTVILSKTNREGYGQYVVIAHSSPVPFVSVYGHLSRQPQYPMRGLGPVAKNDIVGYIGSYEENGHYSPHLHFGIYKAAPDGQYHYWGNAPNSSGDDVDIDMQGTVVGGLFTKPSTYISQPPPPPTGTITWLTFVEGNPGGPGDGQFIDSAGGEFSNNFDLSAPIPLGVTVDGFTITFFLPPGTLNFQGSSFTIETTKSVPCAARFGAGGALPSGNVVVNGVQGIVTRVPQFYLEAYLAAANQYAPGCSLKLSDLVITKLYAPTTTGQFLTRLDAVAFGYGQNSLP